MNEKSHENILVHDISQKDFIGAKPLRIRFDKVNGFMRVYNTPKYLVLFGAQKFDFIYNRIGYLIEVKSGISFFSYFYSYDPLLLEKNCLFKMI